MQINRVTITGADESVQPSDLVALSSEFPFVEWGILLSKSGEGVKTRYPDLRWMLQLKAVAEENQLALAGHICGRWVRDLVIEGDFSFAQERAQLLPMFARLQLNCHSYRPQIKPEKLSAALQPYRDKQYILPLDKARYFLLTDLGVDAALLFDGSGGRGIVAKNWPDPVEGIYCGYAGGLGPDNLAAELDRIAEVVGDRTIWIDMESRVRSDDDRQFDLDKVRKCLEIASPWVV